MTTVEGQSLAPHLLLLAGLEQVELLLQCLLISRQVHNLLPPLPSLHGSQEGHSVKGWAALREKLGPWDDDGGAGNARGKRSSWRMSAPVPTFLPSQARAAKSACIIQRQ